MAEPVHKIKRYVKYADGREEPYWYENYVGGWLATGVKDCNGVEIIEGHKLKVFGDEYFPVKFIEGNFVVGKYARLNEFPRSQLEVIGHVEEDE